MENEAMNIVTDVEENEEVECTDLDTVQDNGNGKMFAGVLIGAVGTFVTIKIVDVIKNKIKEKREAKEASEAEELVNKSKN